MVVLVMNSVLWGGCAVSWKITDRLMETSAPVLRLEEWNERRSEAHDRGMWWL